MAVKKVGRPPKKPDERLIAVSIRLSPAQAESLKKLGGSRWVREQLNHDNPTIQEMMTLFDVETPLGKTLLDLRNRAIESGMRLLTEDEVLEEIKRRRSK